MLDGFSCHVEGIVFSVFFSAVDHSFDTKRCDRCHATRTGSGHAIGPFGALAALHLDTMHEQRGLAQVILMHMVQSVGDGCGLGMQVDSFLMLAKTCLEWMRAIAVAPSADHLPLDSDTSGDLAVVSLGRVDGLAADELHDTMVSGYHALLLPIFAISLT